MVIVERAHADVLVDPAFFERQELLNDQRDIRLVLEFLDDFVGVERNAPNVEIFGGWIRRVKAWFGANRLCCVSLYSFSL